MIESKRLEGMLVDILNGTELVSPANAEEVKAKADLATPHFDQTLLAT